MVDEQTRRPARGGDPGPKATGGDPGPTTRGGDVPQPGATAGSGAEPQGHGDRLSPADEAFLAMETPSLLQHVGGLFVFDPPAEGGFDHPRFLELVRSRLHLAPRYRQRLVDPPLGIGSQVWVDDPDFELSFHVRHAALPQPGTTAQLNEYAARILSRQLDRTKPLWELYVIEGLSEGRIALLSKSHQVMIDGLRGIDIATVILDVSAADSVTVAAPEPWTPGAAPTAASLAREALRDLAGTREALAATARQVLVRPATSARRAASITRGVAATARTTMLRPAPRSLLNQAPGQHRRIAIQRVALEDVKRIKNAFATTVNDVVLALVSDAIGRYLRVRGTRTDGLWLRFLVPVSTRSGSDDHVLGNQVVPVFVDVPVFEMDPVERLRVCNEALREVKSSHHAVGAGFLVGLTDFAPPTIHAMASRIAVRSRLFNVLVTNVPGPQVPVYTLGARLLGAFPFVPLAANQALAVALTSIDGWMNLCFTADYDALPDVERITGYLVTGLRELLACAEAAELRGARVAGGGTATGEPPPTTGLTSVPDLGRDGATDVEAGAAPRTWRDPTDPAP